MSNDNDITLRYCLDVAKTYLNKGFSIIPLKAKSKEPAIKWTPYQSIYRESKDLVQWFSNSDINIGIVTGKISAIFAIDIDGEEAAEYYNDIINSCGDEQLISANNNTMKIKTGSGNINIIFGFNTQEYINEKLENLILWKNNKNDHNEIRIKGEGSYIVAPPSIHPNGKRYTFVNELTPITLSKEQIKKLKDLFTNRNNDDNCHFQNNLENEENSNEIDEETVYEIIVRVKSYYYDGIRNDFVLYFSGWLRKLGVSYNNAEKIIKELAIDDEERNNRVTTLRETYQKQDLKKIAGYSGLLSLLSNQCSKEDVIIKLKEIGEILEKNYIIKKSTSNHKKRDYKKDNNSHKGNDENKENKKIFIFRFVEDYIQLLFKDQFGQLFAYVRINDTNYDLMSLTSHKFERYLYKIFYESEYKIILSKELRNEIIEHLQYKAEFSGITKKLELRVAKTDDDYTFYYDLTNNNEGITAIKITPEGWSIENNPPILFRRYSNQLPQVNPSPYSSFLTIDDKDDKSFDKFIGLLNVKDEDNKLLLKCYIISLFIPSIAKPILMLHGEQGSGKTTLQELIKMLVDPSIVKTLTFPRDINELVQQLSHNYIAYYENVSTIKEWISDALCRAVTGSGFSKRQLYTDDDDIIYFFLRCIGFNGINLVASKADLLDRGIIIQLERISKKKDRKIIDIWNEFEIILPSLLAYIFDVLVKVLQIKQKGGITIPDGLNRMADFEEYAEIISRCMGYREGEFLRVYQNNISVKIDEAIAASPLSMAVVELMNNCKEEKWEGTATELSQKLNEITENELKINIQRIKSYPKSPNYLSRRLNEIKTNLREKGIEIERYKDEKDNRLIKICKVS